MSNVRPILEVLGSGVLLWGYSRLQMIYWYRADSRDDASRKQARSSRPDGASQRGAPEESTKDKRLHENVGSARH